MSSFSISTATATFSIGTDGNISDQNNQTIGTWTTNPQNEIVIQRSADQDGQVPPPETIAAQWLFNDKNQLQVLDENGTELFNFNTSDSQPDYELREARLWVQPDAFSTDFMFFLNGDWTLNEQHLLEFKIGDHNSIIDGVFSDSKSRLSYHFLDKEQPWVSNRLTFSGRWDVNNNDGTPKTKFFYKVADGSEKTFELPGKLIIERGTNQFRYTYDKDNKTFGVTILGFLKINDNFDITYAIDQQKTDDGNELVEQTNFSLGANFHGDKFEGELNLTLSKNDLSPGDYKLGVTGKYIGMLGDTQVMAGFQFVQQQEDAVKTTSFGFAGSIKWKDNQFVYELSVGDKTVSLHLGAEIRTVGGVSLTGNTVIEGKDGELRKVTFLLGISF